MINAPAVRSSLLVAIRRARRRAGLGPGEPSASPHHDETAAVQFRALQAHHQAGRQGRGQVLTLTKTEMWEVPKENVEAVKKAAAEHGANATQLGSDWNQVFHTAPADMKMTDKQKTMMEHAKASKSTMGVGMMAAPHGADGRVCADQGRRPQHRRPRDVHGGGQDHRQAQRQARS